MMRGRQRAGRAWRLMAIAVVAAAAVGGCTGGDDPTVPTVGGAPTTTSPAADDSSGQELAFVACMREEGIADMPDPVPGDTSGRSSVRYALDVLGKGSDPMFQAALDECVDLLPEPPAPQPASADRIEALRQFGECMRDHGLPDFPDMDGESLLFVARGHEDEAIPALSVEDNFIAISLGDPVASAAWDACDDLFPASDDGTGAR